jgi:O-antigen ligase
LGLISLVFWLMAFIFTFRKWIYERNNDRTRPKVRTSRK